MEIILTIFLILLVVVGLRHFFGFWGQKSNDYVAVQPFFDVRKHLNGRLLVDGVIYGPRGRVVSRFDAVMDCTWDGDQGKIHEVFTYADGSTQVRDWALTVDGNTVTAMAPDIVGAADGEQMGNTLSLAYKIRLPEDAGGHVLNARDWIYVLPNGNIINRNEMRKFGVKVAELVASIRPAEAIQ